MPPIADVLGELEEHGLLLQIDAAFPNVCALVVGEPVRGAWWAHPRSHDIFRVNCALAEQENVMLCKLVSGKRTYVHRTLWPTVLEVARSREPWQMKTLSIAGRELLAEVDAHPVQPAGANRKIASELEARLLAHADQIHTESGAHARVLRSWELWTQEKNYMEEPVTVSDAKRILENRVRALNQAFNARGRLPWQ